MPQEPGATIRIDGEMYRELRAIAEARDCSLRQAMDFWIDRQKQEAIGAARQTELKGMPEPKKPKRKGKRKPKELIDEVDAFFAPEIHPIEEVGKLLIPKPKEELVDCPECWRKVKASKLQSHRERVHRVKF